MSECLDLPVKGVSPALWGVKVHWKWPDGSFWGNRLELQCLFADGRLDKVFIPWPVTGKLIGGLKAGERLQVRLRLVDKSGKSRDWRSSDWLDGVSSTDASDYLNRIDDIIRNASDNSDAQNHREHRSGTGWHLNKSGTAHVTDEPEPLQTSSYNMTVGIKVGAGELQAVMEGINKLDRAFEAFSVQVEQRFINDAFIQDGAITNAKIGAAIVSDHLTSKSDDRLMKSVKDDPASNPWVYKGGLNVHAFNLGATKLCLTDEMREAVLDAVRNSDLFQSLVEQVNAQSAAHASTVISLQKGIEQALNDTIRNALQPGGLLYRASR